MTIKVVAAPISDPCLVSRLCRAIRRLRRLEGISNQRILHAWSIAHQVSDYPADYCATECSFIASRRAEHDRHLVLAIEMLLDAIDGGNR